MKNLFALLTVIGAGFVAAPDAEARPYGHHASHLVVSHHTSCGCPVYKQRYVAFYDRCGNPVFRYRILPVSHHCRAVHHPRRGGGYRPEVIHPRHGHGRHTSGGVRVGPVIVGGGSSRCR